MGIRRLLATKNDKNEFSRHKRGDWDGTWERCVDCRSPCPSGRTGKKTRSKEHVSMGPQRSPQVYYSAGPWTTVPIPATLCSFHQHPCSRDLSRAMYRFTTISFLSLPAVPVLGQCNLSDPPFTNRTFSFRAPRPALVAIFIVTSAFGLSSCGVRAEHVVNLVSGIPNGHTPFLSSAHPPILVALSSCAILHCVAIRCGAPQPYFQILVSGCSPPLSFLGIVFGSLVTSTVFKLAHL